MTYFTISQESEKTLIVPMKRITMEQAVDDVIIRVDGLAVVCFRSVGDVMGVSMQCIRDSGLTYQEE